MSCTAQKLVALLVFVVASSQAYAQGSISASFVDKQGNTLVAPHSGSVWCASTEVGGPSVGGSFSVGNSSALIEAVPAGSYRCTVYFASDDPSHVGHQTGSFNVPESGSPVSVAIRLSALDASLNVAVSDQFDAPPSLLNSSGSLSCYNWQSGFFINRPFTSLPVSMKVASGVDYQCNIGQFSNATSNGYAYFTSKAQAGESKDVEVTSYRTDATLSINIVDQFGEPATFSGTPYVYCQSSALPSIWFSKTAPSQPFTVPVVGGAPYSCSTTGLEGHVSTYAQQNTPLVTSGSTVPVVMVVPRPDTTIDIELRSGGTPLLSPSSINVYCYEQSSGGSGQALYGVISQGSSSVQLGALSGTKYSCSLSGDLVGYGRLDYSREVNLITQASGSAVFNFEPLLATFNVQLIEEETGAAFTVPEGDYAYVSCDSTNTGGRSYYYGKNLDSEGSSFSVKEGFSYTCRVNSFTDRAQVARVEVLATAGLTTQVSIPLRRYDSSLVVSFATKDGTPVTPEFEGEDTATVSCYSSSTDVTKSIQNGVPTVALPLFANETYSCSSYGNFKGYGLSTKFSTTVPSGVASHPVTVTVFPRDAILEVQTLLVGADGNVSPFVRAFNDDSGSVSCYGTATDFSFNARLPNGSLPASVAVVAGNYRCWPSEPPGFVALTNSENSVSAVRGQRVSAPLYFTELTGSLTVRIVDEGGVPLAILPGDASLWVDVHPKDYSFSLPWGEFEIEEGSEVTGAVVPNKTYVVEANAVPGYARQSAPVEVTVPDSGNVTVTIVQKKLDASIIVTLVGPDGEPYPVADLSYVPVDCSSELASNGRSIEGGQVSTEVLVLGSTNKPYTCRSSLDQLASKAVTVTAPPGEVTQAEIPILARDAAITVRLVDSITGALFTGVPDVRVSISSIDETVSHSIWGDIKATTGSFSAQLVAGTPYAMWAYIENSDIEGVFSFGGKKYLLIDRALNFNPTAGTENILEIRVLEALATMTVTLVNSDGEPVPGWVMAQTNSASAEAPGIGAAAGPSGQVTIPLGADRTYFLTAYGYGESPISAAMHSISPKAGDQLTHTFVIPESNHTLTIVPSTQDGVSAYYSCFAESEQGMRTWGQQHYRSEEIKLLLTNGTTWKITCEGWAYNGTTGSTYGVDPIEYIPQGETSQRSLIFAPKGSFNRLTSTVDPNEEVTLEVSSSAKVSINPRALTMGESEVQTETQAPLARINIPPNTELLGELTLGVLTSNGSPITSFNSPVDIQFLVTGSGLASDESYSAVLCTAPTVCEQLQVESLSSQSLAKVGVPVRQVRALFAGARVGTLSGRLIKVRVAKSGQIALAKMIRSTATPTPTPTPRITPTPGITPTPIIPVGAVKNIKVAINRKARAVTATWLPPSGHTSANYTLTLAWKVGNETKKRFMRTSEPTFFFKRLRPARYQLTVTATVGSRTGPAAKRLFGIK